MESYWRHLAAWEFLVSCQLAKDRLPWQLQVFWKKKNKTQFLVSLNVDDLNYTHLITTNVTTKCSCIHYCHQASGFSSLQKKITFCQLNVWVYRSGYLRNLLGKLCFLMVWCIWGSVLFFDVQTAPVLFCLQSKLWSQQACHRSAEAWAVARQRASGPPQK